MLVVFLDVLVSSNEKLIEHGITGICNFCNEPQTHQELLEVKNRELIQNLLGYNNPRILAPALTTLIYLREGCEETLLTKNTKDRIAELLKEVESGIKPSKLRNLLLILREPSSCS